MSDKPVRVGIVGAGTVGGGTIEILLNRSDLLTRRGGVAIEIAKVADLNKDAVLAAGASEELWAESYQTILDDPTIDVVVELIGGTGVANDVVESALEAGKAVVTANKALLAEKGKKLFALAQEKGVPLVFEAAVAGGIPIILALREGLVANRITSLLGIMNGTCNYILTEMIGKGVAYEDCLKEAQALGYAEADPTFDVEGIDTGHKLALLSALAMHTWIDFSSLSCEGISKIDLMDVDFAAELGYTMKLLAVARPDDDAGRLFLSVHPALLKQDHPLASVHGSMNAVALYGDAVMESVYYGRGAGRMPTASAVVADIVQVARALRGGAAPSWSPDKTPAYDLADFDEYNTHYYLRFSVEDCPGVLGTITTSLGEQNVSIASVMQCEHPDELQGDTVPVVVVTHTAREGDVKAALAAIGKLDFMRDEPVLIRIEE